MPGRRSGTRSRRCRARGRSRSSASCSRPRPRPARTRIPSRRSARATAAPCRRRGDPRRSARPAHPRLATARSRRLRTAFLPEIRDLVALAARKIVANLYSARLRGAKGGPRGPLYPSRDHDYGQAEATQALPQHRHHRPHRRGQDHDDGARAVLHRQEAPDHRGARHQGRQGQHHHRLPGAGAQARHHDPERGGLGRVEGLSDQPDRHAGARRLHDRGEPQPARARRRRRRVRRRRRRRAADRDQLAPREPVQRPAPLLRQQDGPHRRELRALRERHQGAARRQSAGVPRAVRQLRRVRRHGRPRRRRRLHLELGRQGRRVGDGAARPAPGPLQVLDHRATTTGSSGFPKLRQELLEHALALDEDAFMEFVETRQVRSREAQGVHPQGHGQRRARAGVLRLVVQEQGRAAAARRGHRLPAVPRRERRHLDRSTWTAR